MKVHPGGPGGASIGSEDETVCKVFPLSVLPVCTVPPGPITVPENNTADVQLVQISSGSEVTLTLTVNPDNFFYLKGNALMVKKGLDYEVTLDIFQAPIRRWRLILIIRITIYVFVRSQSQDSRRTERVIFNSSQLRHQRPGGGALASSEIVLVISVNSGGCPDA